MTDEAAICSHCWQVRMLDSDGNIGYHDWPLLTRQVCPGAKKPARTAEDRIRKYEEAIGADTIDSVTWLYHNDPLIQALVTIGAQSAAKFHHCRSCDGHSCDV